VEGQDPESDVWSEWLLHRRHADDPAYAGTAKLNDIDPESYLRYVLTHVADHPVN
jgi:hypothetical protein